MKSDRGLFTLRQSQPMNSSAITVPQSNAFVTTFDVSPIGNGPLDGLRFAVKDTIDMAGFKTGCGNPTWRDSQPAAVVHAVCVEQLLRGCPLRWENHFRRVGLQPSGRELLLRHAAQRACAGSCAGRIVERIGFGRCVWISGFCAGNRYGRLYPRSREQLWNLGLPTVAWLGIGCWRESASAVI